jgi:hypothetical protein
MGGAKACVLMKGFASSFEREINLGLAEVRADVSEYLISREYQCDMRLYLYLPVNNCFELPIGHRRLGSS